VRSNAIDVLVIDSVAALVPRAEIEGEMGDSHVGLQARLMSQALRKLTGSISRSNCMVIFINQLRMKIGVMYGARKPRRAAMRSNSMPRSVSTSAAPARSRTVTISSATPPG
jgi:protein RecA